MFVFVFSTSKFSLTHREHKRRNPISFKNIQYNTIQYIRYFRANNIINCKARLYKLNCHLLTKYIIWKQWHSLNVLYQTLICQFVRYVLILLLYMYKKNIVSSNMWKRREFFFFILIVSKYIKNIHFKSSIIKIEIVFFPQLNCIAEDGILNIASIAWIFILNWLIWMGKLK